MVLFDVGEVSKVVDCGISQSLKGRLSLLLVYNHTALGYLRENIIFTILGIGRGTSSVHWTCLREIPTRKYNFHNSWNRERNFLCTLDILEFIQKFFTSLLAESWSSMTDQI